MGTPRTPALGFVRAFAPQSLGPPILAAVLLGSAAAPRALAAEPPAAAGVASYPAAFFAAMALNTAYDMIQRLPGFTFDDGSAVRGFAGAAGNVLIDGQRPASKTDDLVSVLKRIPVSQVARIDVIRGAQPGIDMQGKTVVANVIRKTGGGFTGSISVGQYTVDNLYTDPQVRLDGTRRVGPRTLQGSLLYFKGHDNSEGGGRHLILAPDGRVLDVSSMHNTDPNWAYKATAGYATPLGGGRADANLLIEDQPIEIENRDEFRFAGRQVQHVKQNPVDGELGAHYARDLTRDLSFEAYGLQHLNRTTVTTTFVTATDAQDFHLADRGGKASAAACSTGGRRARSTSMRAANTRSTG